MSHVGLLSPLDPFTSGLWSGMAYRGAHGDAAADRFDSRAYDDATPTATTFSATFPSAFPGMETPASGYTSQPGPSDGFFASPWSFQHHYPDPLPPRPTYYPTLADVPIIRPPVPPALIAPRPGVPETISPIEAIASPTYSSNGSDGDYEDEGSDEERPIVGRSRSSSLASNLSNASNHGADIHRSQSSASSRSSRSTGSAGDKRFPCPVDGCDRAFARRFNLTSHIASTHEMKKPFVCPRGCGKSFSRRHDNLRHLASVHDASPSEIAAAKLAQPQSALTAPAPVAGPSAPSFDLGPPSFTASSLAEAPLLEFVGAGFDGVGFVPDYRFYHG